MPSEIKLTPIGIIHTPHKSNVGTPIQPFAAKDIEGEIEIYREFREGLRDLEGFERIWALFWCDRVKPFRLKVIPYLDVVKRGLFATRAPSRPNPIGLSSLRLVKVDVEAGKVKVLDVDLLEGTPILDIKPYIPRFDSYPDIRAGWLDKVSVRECRADGRFSGDEEIH